MFKINRDNQAKEFHGFNQEINQSFDSAQEWFDKRTHESMTRKPLSTEAVKKMVNPKVVLGSLILISGCKKSVDLLVR